MNSDEYKIDYYQGGRVVVVKDNDVLENIKQKITELSNLKNVSFLLGAGASSDAVPTMRSMQEEISTHINDLDDSDDAVKNLYKIIDADNLEKKLIILYAKKNYLQGITDADETEISDTTKLIEKIEGLMYSEININLSSDDAKKSLDLYKQFYQKTAFRNKDLSRINIFTTNNDLFNEKALDTLNINYNNGFGGGLERVFNPARFNYTFSQKIDANLEKFEPLDNMVYLYKLHGSISWIEQEGNSLFNIHEVSVKGVGAQNDKDRVLIYPTPLKQAQVLGTPYADLIREFQTKLSLPNSVLFIIGYSFSDEHLNSIIYRSLASNSSISVVIFGKHSDCPLAKIEDNRIYRIYGQDKDKEGKKIHHFEYIVEELLPNVDKNKDKTLLDDFLSSMKMNASNSDSTSWKLEK